MVHTAYIYGWVGEATEGLRVLDGTPANTQSYCYGIFTDPLIQIPHPVANTISSWVYSSWDVATHQQGSLTIPQQHTFIMINGIEIFYALGDSTNTTPSYEQHVIEGLNAGHLPTRTDHYQAEGGTAALLADYVGRKNVITEFQVDQGSFMKCTRTSVGARGAAYDQAIYDNTLAGANQAYDYVLEPVFPPTANYDPYMFDGNFESTWDTDPINTIHSWKLSIMTPCDAIYLNQVGLDQYGVQKKRWPISNWEIGKRTYLISLIIQQNDRYIWDDMLDGLTTKSLDILFDRTGDGDDEILWECDNSLVQAHPIKMPWIAETGLFEVTIVPRTVKATVKDAIAASFYGG